MNRIDDNTFIDVSLITCAEYQLFIDEMRQQGKYFQPDHWTTFQFPPGQSEKPILGVRFFDGVDFCDWLTNRENSEWVYRLPTLSEAEHYPLPKIGISPLSYWFFRSFDMPDLYWISQSNGIKQGFDIARDIDPFRTLISSRALALHTALDRAQGHHIDPARALAFALGLDLTVNLDKSLTRAKARVKSIRKIFPRVKDLNQTIGSMLKRDLSADAFTGVKKSLAISRTMLGAFDKNPRNEVVAMLKLVDSLGVDNDVSLIRKIIFQAIQCTRNVDLFSKTISSAFDLDLDRARNIAQLIPDLIDTAAVLYSVVMRKKGIYPSFEGIRIVKERKA